MWFIIVYKYTKMIQQQELVQPMNFLDKDLQLSAS